jgi:MFS transporter, ACS family, glucarate transporter
MASPQVPLRSDTGSRVRYRVVAFTLALGGVTYLDRVCISTMQDPIMRDLHLDKIQMSWIFSAFTFAYAIFEIPTAWWADKIGSRSVLTRIVAWWSAFTMATALAWNFWSLAVLRFLFGIGEAGAWPNVGRVFSRWIPARERGRVQGIFFAGAHLIGGLTPPLVAWMARHMSWRMVFLVCGFVGLAWAVAWYRWFRDEPRDHPKVSKAEWEMIELERGLPAAHSHGNWGRVFRTRSIIPLCTQYFANAYGFYFFITWLPAYLKEARGMQAGELAIFSGMPLLLSVAADITGGITTDSLCRRFGLRTGRCGVGSIAYFLAAIVMFAATLAPDPKLAGFLIAVAGALSMFTLAPAWATAIHLGGANAAVMGATMNTAGQVGGILSPLVFGYLVQKLNAWNLFLQILAGVYLMAAISWLLINPARKDEV